MKMFRNLLLLLLLPSALFAQLPQLTSLIPARMLTQSEPTVQRLEIKGNNMWPDFMSITLAGQIMNVHFKKNGKDQVMKRSTIGSYGYTLSFISTGWTDTPGDIEVYVTIDAFDSRPPYRSNSLFIKVDPTPTGTPVITSLSNSSFKINEPKEKYYIRIYGKNFGETSSTYAMIGGNKAAVGWQNLTDGVMDVYIPSSIYSVAGTYPVVVHTKYGTSNASNLKFEAPIANKMVISKPITTTNPNVRQIKPVNPTVNTAVKVDDKSKVNPTLIQGITITLNGLIKEVSDRAELEFFLTNLEHVFVVDNQLVLSDEKGNINIGIKATNINADELKKIKQKIQDKANAMKLNISIAG